MATTPLTIKTAVPPRNHPKTCADSGEITISNLRRVLLALSPLLLLYAFYSVVRWLVSDRGPTVGLRHAYDILDLEHRLGLNWELGIQGAILPHTWLTHAANWYYVYGFLPVLISSAVLSAWKTPESFAWWRRAFGISLMLALIGFAFYPLTPPRLLPESFGYVDTLLQLGPHYYGDENGKSLFNLYGSIPSTVNVYAAMPSMHVAWSTVAATLLWIVTGRRRWTALLAVAHPCLMAFAVIATANHYVVDVIGGLLVLLAAILLNRAWTRRHPDAAPVDA